MCFNDGNYLKLYIYFNSHIPEKKKNLQAHNGHNHIVFLSDMTAPTTVWYILKKKKNLTLYQNPNFHFDSNAQE